MCLSVWMVKNVNNVSGKPLSQCEHTHTHTVFLPSSLVSCWEICSPVELYMAPAIASHTHTHTQTLPQNAQSLLHVLHSDFLHASLCYFWRLLQQIMKLGRSGCQGEKETRRQEIIKRNRRQTFHPSPCGSAAGTAPLAVIFDPGEKQTSAERTGMHG